MNSARPPDPGPRRTVDPAAPARDDVLTGSRAAEQATERVYLRIWRAAPGFEPARRSAYTALMPATRRELVLQLVEHGRLEA